MKKVRALGMVGLVPVMGLAFPAANGTAPVTHNPRTGDKTVSLWPGGRARSAPLVTCGARLFKYGTSTHGHLTGNISYSHRCIGGQVARLNLRQAGLTERARFYSRNGARELQTWNAGTIEVSSTYFHSFPNIYAYQVCEALVANSNHNLVKYGPACETATS